MFGLCKKLKKYASQSLKKKKVRLEKKPKIYIYLSKIKLKT